MMAAITLGAALSCQKELNMQVNKPEETISPAEGATWHFSAIIEDPETKMSNMSNMDDKGLFAWANGDEIKIIWDGGYTTATATVSTDKTTFDPTGLPTDGTPIWLVYPSGMTASLNGENLEVSMPAVQKNALAGYFVAKASVGDEAVSFRHPVNYFKFDVGGDGADVTRLTLTSAADVKLTATTLSLAFDGSGIPTATPVSGGASTLTADFDGVGTYYVPVLAAAHAASDLTFQFYRGDARTEKAGAFKYGKELDNERAKIYNWATLPAKATNRYVSTTGSASNNGATADKPWDLATFKGFMENSGSRTADVLALYDGVNIHFAAGTYTPSAKIAPNISIRTNLIGEDKATTIFDGNNSMLLFDIYKQSGETVTFKNFTIQNANNTGSDGGAFRIGNSTRVFTFVFDNCVFKNNQASASGKNGGVFNVLGNTTMTFKNCSFTKNHAASGGGVMYVGDSNASVSFDNCSFGDGNSDNRNYAVAGSVLMAINSEVHSFTDCVFDYNQGTGNWGCVVYLYSTASKNGKVRLNNCLFKNNISKNRGIVSANEQGLIYLNGVTFVDNTVSDATGYGICVHANNQTLVCMNNVTSYNNKCSNSSPTDNNFSFNCDGNFIIVNSTIVDNTPKHVVRQNTADGKVALCNNIVINRQGTAPFWFNASSTRVNNGHNLISASALQGNLPDNDSDMFAVTDATLGGTYSENWDETSKYGVYSWTNSLSGFTPATQKNVEDTIKDYDYTMAGIDHVGTDFYNWLNSIGALGKDGRGVSRGTGNWWPGAYQN